MANDGWTPITQDDIKNLKLNNNDGWMPITKEDLEKINKKQDKQLITINQESSISNVQEPTLWQKIKNFFGTKDGLIKEEQPLSWEDRVDKVVFPKEYKKLKAKREKEDLPFEVYRLVNSLANKHKNLIDNPTPQALEEYENDLRRVVVDKLGYKALKRDKIGNYYVLTADEQIKPINKSTIKEILSSALGDKFEISGAILGAKKGLDLTKNIKSPIAKVAATAAGAAIGAGSGSIVDTFINSLETGQKLTPLQYLNEFNKAAALGAAGELGGEIIAYGVKIPKKIYDKISNLGIPQKLSESFIKKMSKLPAQEQQRVLDALEFAQ